MGGAGPCRVRVPNPTLQALKTVSPRSDTRPRPSTTFLTAPSSAAIRSGLGLLDNMDGLTTDGADFWLFGYGYVTPGHPTSLDSCSSRLPASHVEDQGWARVRRFEGPGKRWARSEHI